MGASLPDARDVTSSTCITADLSFQAGLELTHQVRAAIQTANVIDGDARR